MDYSSESLILPKKRKLDEYIVSNLFVDNSPPRKRSCKFNSIQSVIVGVHHDNNNTAS